MQMLLVFRLWEVRIQHRKEQCARGCLFLKLGKLSLETGGVWGETQKSQFRTKVLVKAAGPSLVSLAAAGGEQGRALRGPCTPQPGSLAPGLECLGYTHPLGVFPRYLPGRPALVWEPVWGSYHVSVLLRALSADIIKPINGQGTEAAL